MSKDSIKNRKKLLILPETKIKDLKTMRLDRLDQKTWLYEAWKEKWNEESEKIQWKYEKWRANSGYYKKYQRYVVKCNWLRNRRNFAETSKQKNNW